MTDQTPHRGNVTVETCRIPDPLRRRMYVNITYCGCKTHLLEADVATEKMLTVEVGKWDLFLDEFGTPTIVSRLSRQRFQVVKMMGHHPQTDHEEKQLAKWNHPDGRLFSDVDISPILKKFAR